MMSEHPPDDEPYGDDNRHVGAYAGAIPMTTAFDFPDRQIERHVGLVFGIVVRSRGAGKTFGNTLNAITGGEATTYTRLAEDTRSHAMDRLIANATELGANAVVGVRFDSSEITQGQVEVIAYGSAVVVASGGVADGG
jgi:uncharacterized protein YbjQ (UPF0145 family)